MNPPPAASDVSSLFGGCTTASVALTDHDDFVLLDEQDVTNVLNAEQEEAEEKEKKALDEWEFVE